MAYIQIRATVCDRCSIEGTVQQGEPTTQYSVSRDQKVATVDLCNRHRVPLESILEGQGMAHSGTNEKVRDAHFESLCISMEEVARRREAHLASGRKKSNASA